MKSFNKQLFRQSLGMPATLPPAKKVSDFGDVKRRPKVTFAANGLTDTEKRLALKNALRYFPAKFHRALAAEFARELEECGHIYMYRFCPYKNVDEYKANMKAFSISDYKRFCRSTKAAGIMLMIQNNLDYEVAQYPFELITYGSNGAVFQNWIQYRLTMKYLSTIENDQTLAMYSGHPMGLFPSHENAPRVVITNGMMIPERSRLDDYNKYNALGVTQYGQMTAGSYMYIGPQGIVHGTTLTLLNAARKHVHKTYDTLTKTLKGKLFVSSGLGGMSSAQAKAAEVLGAVAIIAEVDEVPIRVRERQGWVKKVQATLDKKFLDEIEEVRSKGESVSYAYHGNIVDLWEYLVANNVKVDLGSDQTSLHNPYDGGYCPAGLKFTGGKYNKKEFDEARKNREEFKKKVHASLIRQVDAINALVTGKHKMNFFEYGNSLLAVINEIDGIEKSKKENIPSYVRDIMGPLFFDYGFGPFRWVCTSGDERDLEQSDKIAREVLETLYKTAPKEIKQQLYDNILWVKEAQAHRLVVGSQARILYADARARIQIAEAFNTAIKRGKISAPIVLGRDHHDVSGTDSPYRETNNIHDGSQVTADMAVQNVIGDSFRGATWVSIHNGGGVGWGKAINGGFGMVIEGTKEDERNIRSMLFWDVNNGIARRSWAGNQGAIHAIKREMKRTTSLRVTLPNQVDENVI
ncbi:MAG: urocanate hydratase [Bacteroidetes bacterium]|nr:MAG: urocanate hydratase [Bacteroidota bacterium]